ncbi:FKBP62 [Symbiodinium sp. CCMP2456]|nr:FKBP62 [Symbiodinium sp. CCMP2456]
MAATSAAAYNLAKKLCQEYEKRKKEEKELNLKHENTIVHAENNKSEISRKVTEIDYGKHEKTVKELDRQEKEQEYQRKATEAAQWCTLDHEHGPNCKRPPTSCSQDHQKEWQIYERSTEEKIAAAERFRQEGNEAYRRRNFGLAAVHYRKALLHFDYTFAETEDLQNQVDAVKLPCLLNLAACKCQQEDWDEVLTQCRQALEINPRAVKAHYRVGLAYLARDEFELAKDALTSAHEIEPSNPDITAALKQLKKNMEDYKTRRRDVAKEMLSGKEQAPDVAEQATEQPADVSGAETEEACWQVASVLVMAGIGRKGLFFFTEFCFLSSRKCSKCFQHHLSP